MTGRQTLAERGGEGVVHAAAPAKINLYLHIVGQRQDGYHLIDSLVGFAGIGDTVSVAPNATIRTTLAGPFAPALDAGEDNLVMQAARALSAHAGTNAGAAITLTKRLPVAAGLGGGSADAAATLMALMRLWRMTLSDREIEAMALRLGADVPVCLRGHAARLSGIGELIAPAPPLPPAHLVLANPGSQLATADVYVAFDAQPMSLAARAATTRDTLAPQTVNELAEFLAERGNDLEPTAWSLLPEIAEVIDVLRGQRGNLLARMSGSGPTCFGLFAGSAAAAEAAARVTALRPQWWVRAAPLLSRTDRG